MKTIENLAKISVAQLVIDNPNLAKILEKYKIDYCCGGKISLEEAIQKIQNQDLTLESFIQEFKQEIASNKNADTTNWSEASLTELVDHIVGVHHAFLNQELPRLSTLAKKVAKVHGNNHPELIELNQVFHNLKDELEMHCQKEETVLFPLTKQLENTHTMKNFHCGSIKNPVSVMESEHDMAGDYLAKMRTLSQNYITPDDACTSFKLLYKGLESLEGDLHIHIHKENYILFPKIVRLEAAIVSNSL